MMVEASWLNVTLFDRVAAGLAVVAIRVLTVDDPVVIETAEILGLDVVAVDT